MAESIPIGFRFLPTDKEMLAYLESLTLIKDDDQNHLRKDVAYYSFIRLATLYDMKPWELFKDDGYDHDDEAGEGNELYFLTPLKKKFQNGSRHARTVKTISSSGEEEIIGTWKFQTGPTYIIDYKTQKPLGVKREASFIPNMTEDNEDDQGAGTSCRNSSKKRKNVPEEMHGIRFIMHEYCLNPCDDHVYSLCRIRRKINKNMILINKKMRRPSSPTTNTTTSAVVQPVQEEMTAGYDHHQQHINSICYNDGQQQQEAVLPPEGDVQIISNDVRGLEDMELWGVESDEDFLSYLQQDGIATTDHGGDLLYYDNDRYDNVNHQEVTNTTGVSEIQIHPHVQISDDDKRSAQEIEEDLELPAEWWRQGATAEELGFFNIEEQLRSLT